MAKKLIPGMSGTRNQKFTVGSQDKATQKLIRGLRKQGFKTLTNTKMSKGHNVGVVRKGGTIKTLYKDPNKSNVFTTYEFKVGSRKAQQVMKDYTSLRRVKTAQVSTTSSLSKSNYGAPNEFGIKYPKKFKTVEVPVGGQNSLLMSGHGLDARKNPNFVKKEVVQVGLTSRTAKKYGNSATPTTYSPMTVRDATTITKEQYSGLTRGQKFMVLAKLSDPNVKVKDSNVFAKEKQAQARKYSRIAGVAGKAVGAVGKGLSRGYGRGWGMR